MMALLTCKNHPNLRWGCKDIACNKDGSYNGMRSLFFWGEPTGEGFYSDMSGIHCDTYIKGRVIKECDFPASDLSFAPENSQLK